MDRRNRLSDQHQAELLRSARTRDLQARSREDLGKLATDLATACEAARVAAIRNILQATPDPNHETEDKAQCGFTSLYSALRRVRAELKRKETLSSRRTTPASGRGDARQHARPGPRARAQVSTSEHS